MQEPPRSPRPGPARPLPSEAACSRQFPSPVVAKGSSRWQAGSTLAHQFSRPAVSRATSMDCSMRSRSMKLRNSSV